MSTFRAEIVVQRGQVQIRQRSIFNCIVMKQIGACNELLFSIR